MFHFVTFIVNQFQVVYTTLIPSKEIVIIWCKSGLNSIVCALSWIYPPQYVHIPPWYFKIFYFKLRPLVLALIFSLKSLSLLHSRW